MSWVARPECGVARDAVSARGGSAGAAASALCGCKSTLLRRRRRALPLGAGQEVSQPAALRLGRMRVGARRGRARIRCSRGVRHREAICSSAATAAASVSPGRHQQRRVADSAAARRRRRSRRPAGPAAKASNMICGRPFGPGDVQEGVAGAVDVEQPVLHGHVSPQVGVLGHAQLAEARGQVAAAWGRRRTRPAASAGRARAARQHVGQQERVLLHVDAPDVEDRQLAVVAALEGALDGPRRRARGSARRTRPAAAGAWRKRSARSGPTTAKGKKRARPR